MNCPRCVSRASPRTSALCSAPPVGVESSTGGERGDGFSLAVRAESPVNAWPLGVANHVEKIQIGRHQRLSVPLAIKGSMVPRQWQRPSQAPGKLMPHRCMRRTLERRMT